jgi:hypothetical protein
MVCREIAIEVFSWLGSHLFWRIARIDWMNECNRHCRALLGLQDGWLVKSLDLSIESKRVGI